MCFEFHTRECYNMLPVNKSASIPGSTKILRGCLSNGLPLEIIMLKGEVSRDLS